MEKFEKLGLSHELLNVLKEEGFTEPTEIQEKAIPVAIAGKDILGGSATGSGKTLAFSAQIVESLKPSNRVQALILTPTRELAEQVSKALERFSKSKKLKILAIYGGVGIEQQMRRLAVADVVVGTPGRILDHLNRRTLRLDGIKILVLDEVDKMFDMGFHKDVEKIIIECPEKRQTMMFSATISGDIDYLAKKYTNNPVEISVESYVDPSKLKQIYYDVPNNLKFSLLVQLLEIEKESLVMVFCSTRRNVDFVAHNLKKVGINAIAIHGGLTQSKRLSVLESFHKKDVNVLVCTDVAARGLDIKEVTHVYNYDLPTVANDYVHRIGRTARAGKEGKAIILLSGRDYENFSSITKNSSLNITPEVLPRIERIETSNVINKREGFSRRRPQNFSAPRRDYGKRNFESRGRRDSPERHSDNSRRPGVRRDQSRGRSKSYSNRNPKFSKRNFRRR